MVDPQLQAVKANILVYQRQGIAGEGGPTLHPKVGSLSSVTARVVDCAYSTNKLVYAATGKALLPETPPEHDRIAVTRVLADGTVKAIT